MTEGKQCSVCSSNRFVDDHHYDCRGGELSPETLPLCRRCHQTYHIWGISAFSPDTTEKALVIENRRREILHSLPPDHPQRRRAQYLGELSPLKLEDVRHSRYWYRKWGIKPPRKEKERVFTQKMLFRLPMSPALCGEEWLCQHQKDYTPEEIGALTIEVAYDDRQLLPVSLADKRGVLKKVLREAMA